MVSILLTADFNIWQGMGTALGYAGIAVVTYVSTSLSNYLSRRKMHFPHRPLEVTHKDDLEISIIIEHLRTALAAEIDGDVERCYLSQYGNGQRYLGDADITRKNRTHERVKPGLAYMSEYFRGILLSAIPEETEVVEQAAKNGCCEWRATRTIPECKFRWILEEGGVVAFAYSAVKKGGKIVGFVGANFSDEVKPSNLHLIDEAATAISRILARY